MLNVQFCDLCIDFIDEVERIEKENISEAWSRKNLVGLLSDSRAIARVGIFDNKVVCYYSFYDICDEGNINNLAVDKEYQNKGIGNQMMKDMISQSKKLGVNALTLEVEEDNLPAINLYKKFGFIQEGVRKGFYKNKKDALIMWLRDLI